MADAGLVTGASGRNWRSYGAEVELGARVTDAHKALLCDPQTSGGLLVACAPDALVDVMATFARHGCGQASLIGGMIGGASRVSVEL
jgi:selenide, water dikinase